MPSGIAGALATDGESPTRYEFPICTIALCFPEALLSLKVLYLWIQPVAASIKYNAVRPTVVGMAHYLLPGMEDLKMV